MEKRSYYVSVGTHQVVPKSEDSNYEFEVEATEEEIEQLKELFDQEDKADNMLLGRAKTPYEAFPRNVNQEVYNTPYDERLLEIYKLIYNLGAPATRDHIARMEVVVTGDLSQENG